MVTIKEITYKSFGKCIEISNSEVRIIATIDFGPRIICYSFLNGENIFFEDENKIFFEDSEKRSALYGENNPWYIYGGHRLWTAPEEDPKTYYPDNQPVNLEIIENGVVLTAPIQNYTHYKYQIEVVLTSEGTNASITHRITNCASHSVKLAPWGITALSAGGIEIVPQPTTDTDCKPNRLITFWSGTNMADHRLTYLEKYILLRQDKNISKSCKFGINSEHGFAMYLNHGDLFIKRFDTDSNKCYTDGGMSFETFTNNLFLEMESLGEFREINPAESVEHIEKWELHKQLPIGLDDNSIDLLVKKYIK